MSPARTRGVPGFALHPSFWWLLAGLVALLMLAGASSLARRIPTKAELSTVVAPVESCHVARMTDGGDGDRMVLRLGGFPVDLHYRGTPRGIARLCDMLLGARGRDARVEWAPTGFLHRTGSGKFMRTGRVWDLSLDGSTVVGHASEAGLQGRRDRNGALIGLGAALALALCGAVAWRMGLGGPGRRDAAARRSPTPGEGPG